MNDFELRRQLRELRVEREPPRDLWGPISRQIAGQGSRPKRRRWLPVSLAAAVGVAALVAFIQLQPLSLPAPATLEVTERASVRPDGLLPRTAVELDREYRAALQTLPPIDLSAERQATASLLDDSAIQLRSALQQQPESLFLLEQLRRVYALRLRIAQPVWLG